MYANGQGVDQNLAEAAICLRKAAEQGVAEAQLNFGVMCEQGHGVEQDFAEAAIWFRKAAEQGLEGSEDAGNGKTTIKSPAIESVPSL
jgi:uncharacterized protein